MTKGEKLWKTKWIVTECGPWIRVLESGKHVVAAKQAASYLHAVHVSFIHLKKKKNISVQAEPYCRQTALRPAVVVISYCTIPEVYLAVI